MAEAETAGCNGNVEQAQGLLKLSDQLRDEREEIRKSFNLNSQGMPGSHALRYSNDHCSYIHLYVRVFIKILIHRITYSLLQLILTCITF